MSYSPAPIRLGGSGSHRQVPGLRAQALSCTPSLLATGQGVNMDLACDSVNFPGKSSMIPVLPNSLRPESLVDSWTGPSRSLHSVDVSRSCL